jgi:hypothetical protein
MRHLLPPLALPRSGSGSVTERSPSQPGATKLPSIFHDYTMGWTGCQVTTGTTSLFQMSIECRKTVSFLKAYKQLTAAILCPYDLPILPHSTK